MPRRRADIAFSRAHVLVFIDGCFWHGCPLHRSTPKANREWWVEKLDRNRSRDRETDVHLRRNGWRVLRFWEHEDPVAIADSIEREVRAAGAGRAYRPVD
jgi:DNA mismatch endonuclease (patch repair protein)